MKKNNGSSLIIAIISIVIMSIIMIYFLEKLLPISRNVKGIENSTAAYYSALGGIEEALQIIKDNPIGHEAQINYDTTNPQGVSYNIIATGSIIPASGEGNSDFSGSWNKIGLGKPLQLVIGSGIDWDDVDFYFKIPTGVLINTSLSNSGIINWMISGKNSSGIGLTMYASGENNMIKGNQLGSIFQLDSNAKGFDLNGFSGATYNFENFYKGNLPYTITTGLGNNCSSNSCILKFSLSKPIIGVDNQKIPYLEYKIDFGTQKIPQQFATIISNGYSYGYKRNIKKDVNQYTSFEVTDFTITQ